jgi:hypothetical protein
LGEVMGLTTPILCNDTRSFTPHYLQSLTYMGIKELVLPPALASASAVVEAASAMGLSLVAAPPLADLLPVSRRRAETEGARAAARTLRHLTCTYASPTALDKWLDARGDSTLDTMAARQHHCDSDDDEAQDRAMRRVYSQLPTDSPLEAGPYSAVIRPDLPSPLPRFSYDSYF